MDPLQTLKTSGVKRKKLKQTDNCVNKEVTVFDKKQGKNSQKLISIKKKKLLALKSKSYSKISQHQAKDFKKFKNKVCTIELPNKPKLIDNDFSNNKNRSFEKKTTFPLSSLLPKDIPNTSKDKLNRKKSKKCKLQNIDFSNANIMNESKILEDKNLTQKNQKHIKALKRHRIIENTGNMQELQNIGHKKFKKSKQYSLEEKEIVSENSEDDIEIRKEIQNCSIYKKIQKLLKENPSLSCGLSTDAEQKSSTKNSDESSSSKSLEEIDENSSAEFTVNSKNMPTSVNKLDKTTERMFKRTANTNEKAKLPPLNFLSQSKGSLTRERVNKTEKINASISLRNKAREKLQAAKFRFLNEKLYTECGKDSFTYFQANQDEFQDYHMGYNLQILKWPMNPVDKIISSLQNRNQTYVIADMGCGDAKIAKTLTNCTVHSYDLVALNEHVIPCNISKVPLPNESVDVVVFCLSLMGTNWKDYLREAHRITKMGGSLKIAEVESRIENLDLFIKNVQYLGFTLENKNMEHKIFVFLDFKKEKKKKSKNAKFQDIVLRPCLYKKR